ncbi:hypothetical protein [Streptomyces sp. NPDC001091]
MIVWAELLNELVDAYGPDFAPYVAVLILEEHQKTWPEQVGEALTPDELAELGYTVDCGGVVSLTAEEVAAFGLPLPGGVPADESLN